jgi:hypothetical protein
VSGELKESKKTSLSVVKTHPTPAMNNPKANPKLFQLPTLMLVSAGLQKLPGGSYLENPSNSTTKITRTEEMIPRIDVYASNDKGKNTVGISLVNGLCECPFYASS